MKINKLDYIRHLFDNQKHKATSEEDLRNKIRRFISQADRSDTLNILFDNTSKFIQVKYNFEKQIWAVV